MPTPSKPKKVGKTTLTFEVMDDLPPVLSAEMSSTVDHILSVAGKIPPGKWAKVFELAGNPGAGKARLQRLRQVIVDPSIVLTTRRVGDSTHFFVSVKR